MIIEKNIFDVGAYDGVDGMALALKNPDTSIYAFEANPELIDKISFLKKKVEERIGKKIKNYKISNLAVSNETKIGQFNIAKNPTCSSLKNFSEKIDVTWPGYREPHLHTVKKIQVKIDTLKNFCDENNIKIINYLHIDTQGSDLKVLMGLKEMITKVKQGVVEAAVSKSKSLYEDNHTVDDVRKFLNESGISIKKITPVEGTFGNEANIYFVNDSYKSFSEINLKYNHRYFYRLLENRTKFKDDFKDFFLRTFNRNT